MILVSCDYSLQRLRTEVQEGLSLKLDTPSLGASEKKTGHRITQLEGAILRGLKAVSDRVAAALLEKADAEDLNDFRMQVLLLVAAAFAFLQPIVVAYSAREALATCCRFPDPPNDMMRGADAWNPERSGLAAP